MMFDQKGSKYEILGTVVPANSWVDVVEWCMLSRGWHHGFTVCVAIRDFLLEAGPGARAGWCLPVPPCDAQLI